MFDGNSSELLFKYSHTGILNIKNVLWPAANSSSEGLFTFDPVNVTAKNTTTKEKYHFRPMEKPSDRVHIYLNEFNDRSLRWEIDRNEYSVVCGRKDTRDVIVRMGSRKTWEDGTIWIDLGGVEEKDPVKAAEWEQFLLLSALSMPQVVRASEGIGRTRF